MYYNLWSCGTVELWNSEAVELDAFKGCRISYSEDEEDYVLARNLSTVAQDRLEVTWLSFCLKFEF